MLGSGRSRKEPPRRALRVVLRACRAGAIAAATGLAWAPAVQAQSPAFAYTDINSSGPLTDVWIGNDLSCQVNDAGDPTYEFFPTDATPGDCGTFVSTGGTLYAPNFSAHTGSATGSPGTPFVPVSQSAVTGSGASSSPYQLTTTATAGTLTITETDSYITGADYFQTSVTITNPAGVPAASGIIYRGGDCYLQGSDEGYGFVDPSSDATACTVNASDSPPAPIEEFVPLTAGIDYFEGGFSSVWSDIAAQTDLPDTCDCTTSEDNGMAISWDFNVPAGSSETFSSQNVFSASGSLAATTTATSSSQTASAPAATPPSSTASTSSTRTTTTTTTTTSRPAPPPPPPVLYKAVNVVPVSGTVYIKLPAGATLSRFGGPLASISATKGVGFIPLTQARQIPVGSVLDTTGGTVAITAASPTKGKLYTGDFTAGIFQLLQSRKEKGLAELDLRDSLSHKVCTTVGKGARASAAKTVSNKVLGLLKSTDSGRFSTRGAYSSATVRGTAYSVANTCAGTLTTVTRGVVAVDYFRRHKTVVVKAGHSFLAKASGGPSIVVTIGKKASTALAAAVTPGF